MTNSLKAAASALAMATLLFTSSAQASDGEPEDLGMLGAGIALMPIGTVTAITGSFLWAYGGAQACECPVGAECDCGDSLQTAGLGIWVAGGSMLVTGIVLAAIGGQPKRERAALRPWVGVSPGGGSLTWRF